MRRRGIALLGASLALATAAVAAGASSSSLPPAKQAMADKIANAQGAARAQAGSEAKRNDPGRPVSAPEAAAQVPGAASGIGRLVADSDTLRPPGHPDDVFTNSWTVSSPTVNVDVWAGARGADQSRGFVLVVVWNADRTTVIGGGEFEPAQAHGELRIISATGSQLAITDRAGGAITFDVGTLRFK